MLQRRDGHRRRSSVLSSPPRPPRVRFRVPGSRFRVAGCGQAERDHPRHSASASSLLLEPGTQHPEPLLPLPLPPLPPRPLRPRNPEPSTRNRLARPRARLPLSATPTLFSRHAPAISVSIYMLYGYADRPRRRPPAGTSPPAGAARSGHARRLTRVVPLTGGQGTLSRRDVHRPLGRVSRHRSPGGRGVEWTASGPSEPIQGIGLRQGEGDQVALTEPQKPYLSRLNWNASSPPSITRVIASRTCGTSIAPS